MDIKEIEKIINSLLIAAMIINCKFNSNVFKREAVNWADLSVVEIKQMKHENEYLVVISEASPSCSVLQNYLEKCLNEIFPNLKFNIYMEW